MSTVMQLASSSPSQSSSRASSMGDGNGCKSIGVYSFKGGVRKTTLAANLAGALAAQKHKVLMIDYDPQCNLTDFFKDSNTWHEFPTNLLDPEAAGWYIGGRHPAMKRGEPKIVDGVGRDMIPYNAAIQAPRMKNFIEQERLNTDKTIYSVFSKLFYETNCDRVLDRLKDETKTLITPVNWEQPGETGCSYQSNVYRNLFLIRGSTKMSEFASLMGSGVDSAQSVNNMSAWTKVGICKVILEKLAEYHGFDFIIVDMSPSSAALNEAMAMSCDFILPPAKADSFSTVSAHGMFTENFPTWFSNKRKIIDIQKKNKGFPEIWKLKDKFPKILPFIITGYDMDKSESLGETVSADAMRWMVCIQKFVRDFKNDNLECEDFQKEGMKLLRENLRFYNGIESVLPLCPQNEKIFSVCVALGRTLAELSYDMYYGEYKNDACTPQPNTAEAEEFQNNILKLQGRYNALAKWICWLATQNGDGWTGGRGYNANCSTVTSSSDGSIGSGTPVQTAKRKTNMLDISDFWAIPHPQPRVIKAYLESKGWKISVKRHYTHRGVPGCTRRNKYTCVSPCGKFTFGAINKAKEHQRELESVNVTTNNTTTTTVGSA